MEAVETFYQHELVAGYKNGSFDPKGQLTRAELAVIIQRVHEYVLMNDENTLSVTLPTP